MTSIEHDIIQQFAQLDTHTQQRIFMQLHAYMHIPKNFDFNAWRQYDCTSQLRQNNL